MQYVCRYGSMGALGVMDASEAYQHGDEVIVKTPRGTEIAMVLCEATSAAVAAMVEPTQGQILRRLDAADRGDWRRISAMTRKDLTTVAARIASLGLDMRLVDVERLFGGQEVTVYYVSEQRVDFRELVRLLAGDLGTRIRMRQIGLRHEAKLLADYGDCGQEVCCSRFLSKMPPVSMKMVKLQRASLDPSKITGRCGRLKCCLRYEYDTYQTAAAELPAVGAAVLTREGTMTVVAQDLLAMQLIVRDESGRRVMLAADDVISVRP